MARVLTVTFILGLIAGCGRPRAGVLVMAHGGDEAWNQEVESVVAPLKHQWPTEIAFGMATPTTMEQAIARLQSQGVQRVAVVRMFISGESFLEPTEYILGLRDTVSADPHGMHTSSESAPACHSAPSDAPARTVLASSQPPPSATHRESPTHHNHHMEPPRRIRVPAQVILSRSGLVDSSLVDQILVDRVAALSKDPANESVLILGHGPGDDVENERWLAMMRRRASGIGRLGSFRHVQCETLREDWPEKRAEAEKRIRQFVETGNRDGGRVIVVPFRVSGFGPYKDVLEGLAYIADGRGFCPHPNMTRWLQDTAARTLSGS